MVTTNGTIDDIDRQILELLQDDAKLTIREIANQTNKSATAIRARIQRLEKELIKKYPHLYHFIAQCVRVKSQDRCCTFSAIYFTSS